MIGKTASFASTFSKVLNYCLYETKENGALDKTVVRGELLLASEDVGPLIDDPQLKEPADGKRIDIERIAREYQDVAGQNSRIRKPCWHQILSFVPGEEPDPKTMQKIVIDFADKFGFEMNQFIAFTHRDKEHLHLHVVLNRVNAHGKNTSLDSNNYYEVSRFCREMEKKYGLVPTVDMPSSLSRDKYRESMTSTADRLRYVIDEGIARTSTEKDLFAHLDRQGFKTIAGREISFVDKKDGTTLKGSSLGKEYSLAGIRTRLAKTGEEKELFNTTVTAREVLKSYIAQAVPVTTDWQEYKEFLLHRHGVHTTDTPFEKAGRNYYQTTYTFTHGGNPVTLTSGELGRDYSPVQIGRMLGRPADEKPETALRFFIAEQLPKHPNRDALLQAVETQTDYRPEIIQRPGKDGVQSESLQFVHKQTGRVTPAYDVAPQYVAPALEKYYHRQEQRQFCDRARAAVNEALGVSQTLPQFEKHLKDRGIVFSQSKLTYGSKTTKYDWRKTSVYRSIDGKHSVNEKYMGKGYRFYDIQHELKLNQSGVGTLKDQLAIATKIDTILRETIAQKLNTDGLYTQLKAQGISVRQESRMGNARTIYLAKGPNGKPVEVDSTRFPRLAAAQVETRLNTSLAANLNGLIRQTVDEAIEKGYMLDKLVVMFNAVGIKATERSRNGKAELVFEHPSLTRPLSAKHIGDNYTLDAIHQRLRAAWPRQYEQYTQQVRGTSGQTTQAQTAQREPVSVGYNIQNLKADMQTWKTETKTISDFLATIEKKTPYTWYFVDYSDKQNPRYHRDLDPKRMDGITFQRDGETTFTSGTRIGREFTLLALMVHFGVESYLTEKGIDMSAMNQSRQAQAGVGQAGSASAPKEKIAPTRTDSNNSTPIRSTAAQDEAQTMADKARIQRDLDAFNRDIQKTHRDSQQVMNADAQAMQKAVKKMVAKKRRRTS